MTAAGVWAGIPRYIICHWGAKGKNKYFIECERMGLDNVEFIWNTANRLNGLAYICACTKLPKECTLESRRERLICEIERIQVLYDKIIPSFL